MSYGNNIGRFLTSGFDGAKRVFNAATEQASRANRDLGNQGELGRHRQFAQSLSKPSHPDARRLIAESSPGDMSGLSPTCGPAGPFSNMLKAAANRTLVS